MRYRSNAGWFDYIRRMLRGEAAFITQGYQEANSKNGTKWEAQRRITGMSLNQRATSILKTGSLPVDLKSRVFAYTGTGLVARVFRGPSYTGGAADPVFNMNTIPGAAKTLQSQLLTGFTLTADGVEVAAPIFLIGPSQVQGKGRFLTHMVGIEF